MTTLQELRDDVRDHLDENIAQRLYSKINQSDGCWLWAGYTNGEGYGQLHLGGVQGGKFYAHRLMYILATDKNIEPGLDIDHLCRNRLCVNPDHLEPVTRRENLLRGNTLTAAKAQQTHCVNGHEFTPKNTQLRTRKEGGRTCRACKRNRRRPK